MNDRMEHLVIGTESEGYHDTLIKHLLSAINSDVGNYRQHAQ
jgi:hypothetical protein